MSLTAFPSPPDLEVNFIDRIGDSRPKSFQQYTVSNPHPGYGKDPNILNEYGHTKYPMWVGSVIVKNEEEENIERAKLAGVSAPEVKNIAPIASKPWPSK